MADFEVHPIGTGRQLAEAQDTIRDIAKDIGSVLQESNLSTTQKMSLRSALARAGYSGPAIYNLFVK